MIDENARLWDYFRHPRRVGTLDEGVRGVAGSLAERAIVQIDIVADSERILDARFKAYGNAATIACASYVTQWAVGQALTAARSLQDRQISAALDLPPVAVRSAILSQQALIDALRHGFEHAEQRGSIDDD